MNQWKSLFTLVPVESLVRDQQPGYYAAINACDGMGNSTVFIEFMLNVISDALAELLSVSPQVDLQVSELVTVIAQAGLGRTSH